MQIEKRSIVTVSTWELALCLSPPGEAQFIQHLDNLTAGKGWQLIGEGPVITTEAAQRIKFFFDTPTKMEAFGGATFKFWKVESQGEPLTQLAILHVLVTQLEPKDFQMYILNEQMERVFQSGTLLINENRLYQHFVRTFSQLWS